MSALVVTLSRPRLDAAGLEELGGRWRSLEQPGKASPFQTWAWVGCLAAERYPNPVLLEAWQHGSGVGLALFNNRRGRLWLHESGDPVLDSVFSEHNGPLILAGPGQAAILDAMLRGAMGRFGRRLVLSGVDDKMAAASRRFGRCSRFASRTAPYLDLSAIPTSIAPVDQLSRNTRQQLRRSARAYGGPKLEQAKTALEAQNFLDQLIVLHTASWRARGKPGAFAAPAVRRFHAEMVVRGFASGLVQLSRVWAEAGVIGYLYNLSTHGRVCAYQSGFDYAAAPPAGKPGLTCHLLAVEAARVAGAEVYDFLGGPDRYKRSLSNAEAALHWLELVPVWHPLALLRAAYEAL